MSDGRTHKTIATISGTTMSLGSALLFANSEVIVGVVVGSAVGVFLTPDIDHHVRTEEELVFYRRHPFLGKLYEAFWAPYAVFFDHRGVSHWPVVGTITRAVYPLFVLVTLSRAYFHPWWEDVEFLWLFWLALFVAWVVQDMVHIVTDGIDSAVKRWRSPNVRVTRISDDRQSRSSEEQRR